MNGNYFVGLYTHTTQEQNWNFLKNQKSNMKYTQWWNIQSFSQQNDMMEGREARKLPD